MKIRPQDLRMKNLQPWEEVKMVIQRHWIALVYIFWYAIFLFVSTIFLLFFWYNLPIIWKIINIVIVIYISVFLLVIYINWMRYELDLYIITSKRIIGLEEVTFLNRHVSECSLEKVQEVNVKTTGILSNLLNYWVVTIHTASEASDFQMELVPDAITNTRIITNFISQYKNPEKKTEI